MNTRTLRKWLALIGILSIVMSMVIVAPMANAYAGADAPYGKDQVDKLIELGAIDAKLDPGFGKCTTRAAAAVMLTKLFAEDVDAADLDDPEFADYVGTEWWGEAVKKASFLGMFAGSVGVDGKKYFKPADSITREQFATVLWAAAGKPDSEFKIELPDAGKISSWAAMGAAWAAENDLMGKGAKFGPQDCLNKLDFVVVSGNTQTAVEEGNIELTFSAAEEEEEVAEEEEEEEEEEETPAEEEVPVVPQAGALTVALATDTAVAKTINAGASGVPVASFTFSVAENEATVTSLTFKRTGGGAYSDFSSVALYQGAKRLKSGKTIASDTNTVEFSGLSLAVKKDAPATVTLKANLTTTAAAASTHQFGLEKAESIVTTAGSITGAPVIGNVMTVGGATAGTLTVATVNTLSKPTLGSKQAEVGNFKLTAGSNDVTFNAITLTHGGTVAKANLGTFKLTDNIDTTKVLAEAAAIDGDLLVFVLKEAYKVSKNNNRSFRVWADILGGKTTDTLDFYLDETSDIDALDSTIGYGAQITNSLTKALVTDTTFQGGKITLADNGPVASNVATNTTNVHLFDFSLTSDRSVTVRDYYLWLEQTAFDGTSAVNAHSAAGSSTDYVLSGSISTAGAVTALNFDDVYANLAQYDVIKITNAGTDYYIRVDSIATGVVTGTLLYPLTVPATVTLATTDDVSQVFDAHLRTRVKNLKLIDTDSGGTIASVTNTSYLNTFSDDFDLTTGKARNFAVMADIDSSLAANNAFKGGVNFSEASTIKDLDANEFIATSDVVGGNTFGKTMTAVSASLTVSLASTPVSQTFVKGQSDVNAVGLSVKAGDGGDVKVSKVILRLVADNDYTAGSFDGGTAGYGDIAANTLVDTVSLYKINADGTETKIAGPVGLSLVGTIGTTTGHYKAEFASLAYTVAKAATEKWVAKVKFKNTISSTHYFVIGVDPDNDIEAQDKDGNTVTPGGTTVLNIGATPTVMATIATAGTLTGVQEGSPDASVAVAGATAVPFAKYKFTATNEAFTILKLDVVGTTTDATAFNQDPAAFTGGNNITKVSISYPKKDGTTGTASSNLASGKASFTNLDIYVPKDGSAVVTVLGDINTISLGATSGASLRLGLNELATVATNAFEAQGEGSNEKKTSVNLSTYTNSTSVKLMVVRKTVPTVEKLASALTKLNSGQNTIAAVTVAADAKAPVAIKRLAFEYNSTATITVNALTFYKKQGSGTDSNATSDVSIRNRAGQNLKSGGSDLNANAVTTDTIYVTWDKTANGGVDELRTLAGVASGLVESTAASVANTRTVWRWLFNVAATCPYAAHTAGCVFLDRDGDGAVTVATDPVFAVAPTALTASTSLTSGAIIPGALRYTTTDVNGTVLGESGVYWDLSGFDVYTVGTDISIARSVGTTAITNDGVVTQDIRYSTAVGGTLASTGAFIDVGTGDAFTVADSTLIGSNTVATTLFVTALTTAPAANAELFTASNNFIWSDNSNTSHATTTTDWTNGVDIPTLPTTTLSLSF
ncbi:S-layer homology domain-containing protein [Candidatus Peregrinibacteria bacterium]|nr:S-layer homology domain-containing protein [Candidatus Peregrinibacteria bacterium]